MANVRIEVHGKALIEIMRGSGTLAMLRGKGANIASRAGPGNEIRTDVGARRARVAVITATREARFNQGHRKTLTKAVGAAR